MSNLQAIIFKKNDYTKRQAEMYLRRHKYKPIKAVHETLNYYRYRLKQPDENNYNYRLMKFAPGIKAVIEYAK